MVRLLYCSENHNIHLFLIEQLFHKNQDYFRLLHVIYSPNDQKDNLAQKMCSQKDYHNLYKCD